MFVHHILIKFLPFTVLLMDIVSFDFPSSVYHSVYLAVPCVIALLPGRSAISYKHLFELLQQEAKQLRLKFKPDIITTDFEPGLVKAINDQVCFLSNFMR